jgi:hypothetical protein
MSLSWGSSCGQLELRQAGGERRLLGRFAYGVKTILASGGRGARMQLEQFAPGAFAARLADPEADVHLLVQHDFGRPLASRSARTLELRDAADALEFEARIAPEVADTSHGRDALALLAAGLAKGLSPGFRVEPGGESISEQRAPEAVLRTIHRAELVELSLVTRPAYAAATVEARRAGGGRPPLPARLRWRA